MTAQSIPGTQLLPGQHIQGLVGFSQRRVLERTIFEMMGFSPSYTNYSLLPITWLPSSANSLDTSVARATLTLERLPSEYHLIQYALADWSGILYQVTEEYRLQSFLSMLTSIGGLLAALQGLHSFLFGMPLFWGFFGSKQLNPFGIFGIGVSDAARERMRELYGPLPPRADRSHTLPLADRLALFLCDFLVETGPLADREEEPDVDGTELQEARPMLS